MLVLQAQRHFLGGVAGDADSESDGEALLSAPRLGLLVALVAAAVWDLHPWLLTATIDNAQSHAVALLFFVLAVARWEKPWLAGIFLALAASTRLEFGIAGIVAFFLVPALARLSGRRTLRTHVARSVGTDRSAVRRRWT